MELEQKPAKRLFNVEYDLSNLHMWSGYNRIATIDLNTGRYDHESEKWYFDSLCGKKLWVCDDVEHTLDEAINVVKHAFPNEKEYTDEKAVKPKNTARVYINSEGEHGNLILSDDLDYARIVEIKLDTAKVIADEDNAPYVEFVTTDCVVAYVWESCIEDALIAIRHYEIKDDDEQPTPTDEQVAKYVDDKMTPLKTKEPDIGDKPFVGTMAFTNTTPNPIDTYQFIGRDERYVYFLNDDFKRALKDMRLEWVSFNSVGDLVIDTEHEKDLFHIRLGWEAHTKHGKPADDSALGYLLAKRNIQAIKALRDKLGCSLREAKDRCDAVIDAIAKLEA